MSEYMGYKNVEAVYRAARHGLFLKVRKDGKRTTDTLSLAIMQNMAFKVYDWPPEKKNKTHMVPVRLYTLGWRSVAEDLGMLAADMDSDDVYASIRGRELTARNRVTRSWKFLTERGLMKRLYPSVQGKNAGYLLLLGDEKENKEVEAWDRDCLGMWDSQE